MEQFLPAPEAVYVVWIVSSIQESSFFTHTHTQHLGISYVTDEELMERTNLKALHDTVTRLKRCHVTSASHVFYTHLPTTRPVRLSVEQAPECGKEEKMQTKEGISRHYE